jgi:hypothetical protein
VPGDDLRTISDLQDNHQRALAAKLGITSLQALAEADQRAIHTALENIRPYVSLARIAAWQDAARRTLSDPATDSSNWHTAASFAVIFAQRRVGDVWERRLEAGQTEVEPAAESRQWPGWDCGPLCDWMLGQLGPEEDQPDSETAAVDQAGAAAAAKPLASAALARAGRAKLRIDSATISDAFRELGLIRAGELIAASPEDLSPPVRLSITVSGGQSGQQLRAAVWFRRQDGPGWSPHEPAIVPPTGQAEFDLSSVPPGGHDIRLLAWATDAGATLAAVTLPRLTFRQEAEDNSAPAAAGL